MEKGVFEDLGITNKELLEFNKAIEEAAKNKQVTEKFRLIEPVFNALKEYGEKHDKVLSFEYTETSAIVRFFDDYALIFTGESKEMLEKVLPMVDDFMCEIDSDNENSIMATFIIRDIFEL